jgi:serine/threonine protein kinase
MCTRIHASPVSQVLTHIRHTNIVRYYGAVASAPTYCLVLEYCPRGDLRAALDAPTPAGFFLRVAHGIACGMVCLHQNGMMHRDLKSPNILIDEGGTAKLTDFGLALKEGGGVSPRDAGNKTEVGSFRWMAPEVARRLGFTRLSDVYSMGMVLFELLTHDLPFADVAALHAVAIVAVHGARPPLPPDAPPALTDLIRRCWSEEPASRPSFEQVEQLLRTCKTQLSDEQCAWIDEPDGHRVYTTLNGEENRVHVQL